MVADVRELLDVMFVVPDQLNSIKSGLEALAKSEAKLIQQLKIYQKDLQAIQTIGSELKQAAGSGSSVSVNYLRLRNELANQIMRGHTFHGEQLSPESEAIRQSVEDKWRKADKKWFDKLWRIEEGKLVNSEVSEQELLNDQELLITLNPEEAQFVSGLVPDATDVVASQMHRDQGELAKIPLKKAKLIEKQAGLEAQLNGLQERFQELTESMDQTELALGAPTYAEETESPERKFATYAARLAWRKSLIEKNRDSIRRMGIEHGYKWAFVYKDGEYVQILNQGNCWDSITDLDLLVHRIPEEVYIVSSERTVINRKVACVGSVTNGVVEKFDYETSKMVEQELQANKYDILDQLRG